MKTTQPKRYLVKPNQGILEPGQSERIQIQIVPKDRVAPGAKPLGGAADRFLILVGGWGVVGWVRERERGECALPWTCVGG